MEIYFASAAGKIKIGISRNTDRRLGELSRELGEPMTLIGAIEGTLARERAIHKSLARYRLRREWYRDCSETRAAIQNCFNNFERVKLASPKCGSSPFGRVCKALWPIKTAEELAVRVGCAVRTAAYEISGEREPSARSVAVIVDEITRKRE